MYDMDAVLDCKSAKKYWDISMFGLVRCKVHWVKQETRENATKYWN